MVEFLQFFFFNAQKRQPTNTHTQTPVVPPSTKLDLIWQTLYNHRYGGGRITNCSEPAGKCHSTCAEHRSKKLLIVEMHRLWKQVNRVRVVTDSKKNGIHVPKFLLVVIRGNEPVIILSFVCWTGPTCSDQWLGPVLIQYSVHQAWLNHVCSFN